MAVGTEQREFNQWCGAEIHPNRSSINVKKKKIYFLFENSTHTLTCTNCKCLLHCVFFFFFFFFIYLPGPGLSFRVGSHVESSSLNRDGSWGPCIGTSDS